MPDPLAGPYARMVAQQRAYNERQAADLATRRTSPPPGAAPSGASVSSALSARMYQPTAGDIADLRRQQADFGRVEHRLARENAWMAVPVLAPVAAVVGLEAAAAIAARLAPAAVEQAPLRFVEREPYKRVGDNGRRARVVGRTRRSNNGSRRSRAGTMSRKFRGLAGDR